MTGEFAIAVHALVYLNHKGCCLSSEELAKNVCTNPARIRMVMGKLKAAGLVATKEGSSGGYSFTGDPGAVTLLDVSEAVNARFIGPAWRSGDMDMECLIASGMANIMDGIYSDMEKQCRRHLRDITVGDIDGMIFKNKKTLTTQGDSIYFKVK
ncbi:MAG: Rrf2 family transcriptional regulator [Synergistaceae bacterium]|nr:Rrf2 family transcriptional regulator [Synergistaceae bacterium]